MQPSPLRDANASGICIPVINRQRRREELIFCANREFSASSDKIGCAKTISWEVDGPGLPAFPVTPQRELKKRWVQTIDDDVTELEGNPVKRPGKTRKRTSISES